MTKVKAIIAGLAMLVLMGMLVALSFIGPIFAQGVAAQTGGSDAGTENPAGEDGQTVTTEQVTYFGLDEAIAKAAADGVISAEQAAQLQDMLAEVQAETGSTLVFPGGSFEIESDGGTFTVTGEEAIAVHSGAGGDQNHIEVALDRAVEKGLLSQDEADQILADLDAGTLAFLMVADEGVFTDPADVPAELQDLIPEDLNPDDTVVVIRLTYSGGEQADVDVFSGEGPAGFLDRLLPGRGSPGPTGRVVFSPDILAEAVDQGLITAEQADAIRSMVQYDVEIDQETTIIE